MGTVSPEQFDALIKEIRRFAESYDALSTNMLKLIEQHGRRIDALEDKNTIKGAVDAAMKERDDSTKTVWQQYKLQIFGALIFPVGAAIVYGLYWLLRNAK